MTPHDLTVTPTADGLVHVHIGAYTAEVAWPDAIRIGRMLQAMAAVAAIQIGVADEVLKTVHTEACDVSEQMAYQAAQQMR